MSEKEAMEAAIDGFFGHTEEFIRESAEQSGVDHVERGTTDEKPVDLPSPLEQTLQEEEM